MSTTLVAAVLALAGILAVAGLSYVFYLVGRAEDRERAAIAEPPPQPPPPESQQQPRHEHGERSLRPARERRRPMPPRRPQR